MPKLPVKPECLKASFVGRPVKVDEEAKVLRGFVVAQLGPFKSEGRGEFDLTALKEIVRLGNESKTGLKSRFTHPDMSSDGLGKHLGRARDFSLTTTINAAGEKVPAVRADLHFDESAFDTPSGDLAGYVMRLAKSDPDAISSSLVLKANQEPQLEKNGKLKVDAEGNELPPLWMPTKLMASDIVDTGDAVDGLLSSQLSTDGLPMGELWRAGQMLDSLFDGQTREVIERRCWDWLTRHLDMRYGRETRKLHMITVDDETREIQEVKMPFRPRLERLLLKLDKMALTIRENKR